MAAFDRITAWSRVGREIARANRRAPVRALSRASRWRLLSALLPFYNPPFVLDDGLRVHCPRLSSSARRVAYYGGADRHLLSLLQLYLRAGDRVVDVGANVGLISLAAARAVGPTGKVAAFEASPATVAFLERNVALNGLTDIVDVHRCAVGSEPGSITFTDELDETNHRAVSGELGVEVPVARLADVLGGQDEHWALWKLDVEGMELDVLRGAEPLLARGAVDLIVLEVNGSFARYGYKPEDVESLLDRHHYSCASLDGTVVTYGGRLWDDILAINRRAETRVLARLGATATRTLVTTWGP